MEAPICPKCNSPMVKRSSARGPFWGCSTYPRCKGTRNIESTPVAKKALAVFEPSRYQAAVFDFVQNGQGNAVVEAVAGSGKTTTILQALQYTDRSLDVAFVAFNKHIARELQERAPDHVHVSTLHSLGFSNIRSAWGKVQVEERKVQNILKDIGNHLSPDDLDMLQEDETTITRLCSLVKGTMSETNDQALTLLCDHFDLETNGDAAFIFDIVRKAHAASVAQTGIVDFDDMIYFCAAGMVPCRKFDFLFIDETQDLNASQLVFAQKSIKPSGRIVAVGDRYQSIYGFRGADVNAIPNMIDALQAAVLPLSISYRCPSSHIELAQALVPSIEAFEHAKPGTIETIHESELLDHVQDGDLVLCRRNAPLVKFAFRLLANGVKVTILGRDIASNLISIIKKVEHKAQADTIESFFVALDDWSMSEISKLEHANKLSRADSLRDKAESILAIATDCDTVQEVCTKIDKIFSDDHAGVTFSTVHKAKGGEAERVFLLKPDELGSTRRCTQEWEAQQEFNIQYVAFTRSKDALYFVEAPKSQEMVF